MASRQMWQMPSSFTYVAPVPEHATISCCNGSVCRAKLHVSVEDMREGTVPLVEGWRTTVKGGQLYAYCGRCAPELLPAEEAALYRNLRRA